MSLKHKGTPDNRAYWDHVERVAADVRGGDLDTFTRASAVRAVLIRIANECTEPWTQSPRWGQKTDLWSCDWCDTYVELPLNSERPEHPVNTCLWSLALRASKER